MSTFLSGAAAECGPSNVLKNVQGRVDRDYSLQQDRLVSTPNVSGSSRQPFRPQVPLAPPSSRETTQSASPFDLASLRQHLSPPTTGPQRQDHAFPSTAQAGPSRHVQRAGPASTSNGWSQEFARNDSPVQQQPLGMAVQPVAPAPWQVPHQPMPAPQTFLNYPAPMQPQYHASPIIQDRATQSPAVEKQQPTQPEPITTASPMNDHQDLLARTAEAFIAQDDVTALMSENPKLAQSDFMSLVRGIGGQDVVIDPGTLEGTERVGAGGKLVERTAGSNWAKDFFASQSSQEAQTTDGTQPDQHPIQTTSTPRPQPLNGIRPQFAGIAHPLEPHHHISQATATRSTQTANQMDARWEAEFADQEALIRSSERAGTSPTTRSRNVHFDQVDKRYREKSAVPNTLEEALATTTAIPGAGSSWAEQGLLDEDDFNDEVFMGFNGFMRQGESSAAGAGQKEGWGQMQQDWEQFVRSDTGQKGIRGMGLGDQTERYLFQRKNPYFAGSNIAQDKRSATMDSPTLKGVLALEAAVQESPQSHDAWYALGLKQQENEREEAAILALSKVVQLEPDYRPAYLALAVSYTNEGEGEAACTMLEKWIRLGEAQSLGSDLQNLSSQQSRTWGRAGREELIERLIDVARRSPEEVDADVQVALGVLFNGTEEYHKAEDCFLSALEVRPDDWLLYNRLGATLANSGRSNEAIQYYHKALSLHPNFVRALFNLGISYINLGQYPLGAQSALDALRIQHADASEGYAFGENVSGSKGVTSDALWNTLRGACVQ
ncbi:hypothetical protein I317_01590 [Kwoniella heveanensis CBS 569]|nr:hypothetical protein I317_01590 [Kwoniella heveanensis CBS 569]